MPHPLSPWSVRALEVLSDGEDHTTDELAHAAGPLVPPGRAARHTARLRARRAKAIPSRRRGELEVGRRDIVVRSLRSMARSGHVVRTATGWKLGER